MVIRFIKWIWRFFADLVQAWQVWVWFAPAGLLSAMTGLFANAASVPPYLVLLYSSGVFCTVTVAVAAIYHALLRRKELTDRTTAENKLDYVGPHFKIDVGWDAKGLPTYFEKMNVGLLLRNLSRNTIHAKILSFHAIVEGRAPNTDRYVGRVLTVVPQAVNASHPDPLDLTDLKKTEVKGTIDFEIQYGLPGDLRYMIKRKQEFDMVIHRKNSLKPNVNAVPSVRDRE